MSVFDREYWDARYDQGAAGWDIGYAAPQLTKCFDDLEDRNQRILVPGAGFGHEAVYLISKGFTDVHVLDISAIPLEQLKNSTGNPKELHCHHEDFFLHNGAYDLIVEQTFFCAIHPEERRLYVDKVFELLKEGGMLIGLFWNVSMNPDRPPFGGSENEYRGLFEGLFEVEVMEPAKYSIKPRSGRELFISIKKTDHSLERSV
jgi:SAM-dependent methyltransferase